MIVFSVILTGCSSNNSEEDLNVKAVSEIEYFNSKLISVLNKLNNITFENYKMTAQKTSLNENSTEEEKSSSSSSSQNSGEGSSGGESGGNSGGSSGGNSGGGSEEQGQTNTIITSQMSPNTILNPQTSEIDWNAIKNDMENLYFTWNTVILDLYKLNVNSNDILAFSNGLDTATNYIKNEDKENSLLATANLYGQLPRFLEIVSDDTVRKNIIQTKSYVLNAYALVRTKFMGRCSNRNCKGG